jgi:thiol-disulfide isomerase/thioredoxin
MIERLVITVALVGLGVCVFLAFRYGHLRRATRAAVAIGKPVILYFRSDLCAPCTAQGRFLQQLQAEFGDRVLVQKVDAHVDQATAERYGVFTLPTTLVMDARGAVRHANYGLADVRKLTGQLRTLEVGAAA